MIGPVLRDGRGAMAVEFEFALVVLIAAMLCALQVGVALHTQAGMRHAIGEGARVAMIDAGADETKIEQSIEAAYIGIKAADVVSLTATPSSDAAGMKRVELSLTYDFRPNLMLVQLPAVRMNVSRTIPLP
jgi:Flp pilus assembly protein TadG